MATKRVGLRTFRERYDFHGQLVRLEGAYCFLPISREHPGRGFGFFSRGRKISEDKNVKTKFLFLDSENREVWGNWVLSRKINRQDWKGKRGTTSPPPRGILQHHEDRQLRLVTAVVKKGRWERGKAFSRN